VPVGKSHLVEQRNKDLVIVDEAACDRRLQHAIQGHSRIVNFYGCIYVELIDFLLCCESLDQENSLIDVRERKYFTVVVLLYIFYSDPGT
jgi:hypothetical protein